MTQLTRVCFQRFLGFLYLTAFLVTLHQARALIGQEGLLPVKLFLSRVTFWDAPSIFWINASDPFLTLAAWAGVMLSLLAMTGISEAFGIFISATVWFLLWLIYLSFVNVGQVFYSFGWETLLLEIGFLAIFLGSADTSPPQIIFWLFRWVLFRVMFGAGLIKIRGDQCWRDLTCLIYHYETQPMPNPLSWYFHHLPAAFHKTSVPFTHFVELVVPWGLFFPGGTGYAAGIVTIAFQILLILSGNLSWLNYLTILPAVACFDDAFLRRFLPLRLPETKPLSTVRRWILNGLAGIVVLLSIPPVLNMISPAQMMNASFEPFHLVNTYGAFGSVTRERNEIIIEGTEEEVLGPVTKWREYEFKAKPGDVKRRPPIVAPYHYRLDWLMWFAAMSDYRSYPWILNLTAKLLQGDPATLQLLANDPFPQVPPKFIRAVLYRYRFTTTEEKKKTGHWWSRMRAGEYLPPLSLNNPRFREILREEKWLV